MWSLGDPEWDRILWLKVASTVGNAKGTCRRRNVGAVLVANGRMREIGWNGMERPYDSPTCDGGGCPRGLLSKTEQPPGSGYSNCVYLHAEFNVLINYRFQANLRDREGWAAQAGIVVYSSSEPCEDCVKYAKWAGAELIWEQ